MNAMLAAYVNIAAPAPSRHTDAAPITPDVT